MASEKRTKILKYKEGMKTTYTRKELRPIIKMRQSLKRNKENQKKN
jgi:hypothetical protein